MLDIVHYHRARVIRWVDGDTVYLDVDADFHMTRHDKDYRLAVINCPEKRDDIDAWARAKAFSERALPAGTDVLIRTYKEDNWDRYIIDIWDPSIVLDNELPPYSLTLNNALLLNGHAKLYKRG